MRYFVLVVQLKEMTEHQEETSQPGFSRSGFAPIPHRHSDIAPLPTSPPPRFGRERDQRDDWDRERNRGRERELPRRELDPPETDERERLRAWEDYPSKRDNRGHWEDDVDRPKRRRSPSPLGPSHRPRLSSPSPPRFLAIPDPASIETLLPFRSFAEWFRNSHPQTARSDEEETRKHKEMIDRGEASEKEAKEKVGMAKRYERYRKEFLSRQLYALFLTHKETAWFKEKYSQLQHYPTLRRRVNRQGRIPQVISYISALRADEYNNVTFDQSGDNEQRGDKDLKIGLDEPEGLNRALGDKGDRERLEWGDEDVKVEIAPRAKQIFVKTVPPLCSRKTLEELFKKVPNFQWLALSDPSTKRSFFRVAWAQYADETDVSTIISELEGTKIDGFTFHMTINTTPSIGRVKVAPPSTHNLDRLLEDGQKARALAMRLEEELLGDDDEEFAKKEGEGEGEEQDQEEEKESNEVKNPGLLEKGSDVVEETIQKIIETKQLTGDDLNDAQRAQKAKIILDQWISYLRHGLSTCYYCVSPCSFAEELHRKCIAHVRAHPSASQPQQNAHIEGHDEHQDESVHRNGEIDQRESIELTTIENEDLEVRNEDGDEDREMRDARDTATLKENDLGQKTPERRVKKMIFPQKTIEEKWLEAHEMKIAPLLGDVDVKEYGGRNPEDETKKLTAPLIKQEEANKYRCKECSKLFRAPEFVIKHVTSKHPEITQTKIDDVHYLNSFVLDPQHLQPSIQTLAAIDDKLPTNKIPIPTAALPAFSDPSNSAAAAYGQNQMGMGHGHFNVMQQQMMMMMQMQHAMMMGQIGMLPGGANGGMAGTPQSQGGKIAQGAGLAQRMGGYASSPGNLAPLPPAPPGGEDPRASKGRVSYQDLDEPGAGDGGGLPY
ncbi:hypothetical protein L204_105881 [Cryptococcus depauperatus]